jgi:hypothetical protein
VLLLFWHTNLNQIFVRQMQTLLNECTAGTMRRGGNIGAGMPQRVSRH